MTLKATITKKDTKSFEVAVTYFMTPEVTVTFCSRFDLVYDPKRQKVH